MEAAMSDFDWEQWFENVQRAMKALDEAHAAKEKFTSNASPETYDAFKKEMGELCDHLSQLHQVLEHEGIYFEEEMIDAFKQMAHSQPLAYRRMPHLKNEEK
jgi:hypothetical protein